jgi:DNA-binding LytR/AlgR family response regulator
MTTISLEGLTIMVLEDDFLAALELKRLVEERAGTVAGPVGRLEQAEKLARDVRLDGAILDVQLDGTVSLPLADALIAQGVPVILVTGYDITTLPDRFANTPRLPKPFSDVNFDEMITQVFSARATPC